MSVHLGEIVLAGWHFPITKMELSGGKLHLTAQRPGPVPQLRGNITIFGTDGLGFAQGEDTCPLPRAVREGEVAQLDVTLALDTVRVLPRLRA